MTSSPCDFTIELITFFCINPDAMSVVPQAALAVRKVRQNEEKKKYPYDASCLTPMKYSGKYMNSIWGMYNRYSVHNLKKNMDLKVFTFMGQQESVAPRQTQRI